MSTLYTAAVWDSGLYEGAPLLMMLALADFADVEGWCFPSYETLAKKMRRDVKTVYRLLAALESSGAITRQGARIGICEPQIAELTQRKRVKNKAPQPPESPTEQPADILNSENSVLSTEKDILNIETEILNIETPFYIEPSINRQLNPLDQLIEVFWQRTGISPNKANGKYKSHWEKPLMAILDRAQGDIEAAKNVLNASLDVAAGENDSKTVYPVASPWSLKTIAFNQANKHRAAATVADDDTIWQRALAAVTRRDFTDERLKAAIRAIGGTGRIASANGHDTETLKRSLGHAYRNVAAA